MSNLGQMKGFLLDLVMDCVKDDGLGAGWDTLSETEKVVGLVV